MVVSASFYTLLCTCSVKFQRLCPVHQRIQYAKSKSDAVSKQEGTYVQREKKPKEKRKAPEQGKIDGICCIG